MESYLEESNGFCDKVGKYVHFLIYLRYYDEFSKTRGVDFKVNSPTFLLSKENQTHFYLDDCLNQMGKLNLILFEKVMEWSSWEYLKFSPYEVRELKRQGCISYGSNPKSRDALLSLCDELEPELRKFAMKLLDLASSDSSLPPDFSITLMWNRKLASYLNLRNKEWPSVQMNFLWGDTIIHEALSVLQNPLRAWWLENNVHSLLSDKYVIGFCETMKGMDRLDMNFGASIYALDTLLDYAEDLFLNSET
jgi:hypothetical protein